MVRAGWDLAEPFRPVYYSGHTIDTHIYIFVEDLKASDISVLS